MKKCIVMTVVTFMFVALFCACSAQDLESLLPGLAPNNAQVEYIPTVADVMPEEETTETQIIACEDMYLDVREIAFSEAGESRLIYVTTWPTNTTEKVHFTSSDISVASVNEEGKVTAVGEGNAWIVVTCGDVSVVCEVECVFEPEVFTEPMNEVPYLLTIATNNHNIYTQPTYNSSVVRGIEKGIFTIVEEQHDTLGNLWGRLKSGLGWVCVTDINAEN